MVEALVVLTTKQIYEPIGGLIISALIAAIPLYILFYMLAVARTKAHYAAGAALLSAMLVAALFYKMPLGNNVSAALNGFAFGLWPIFWVVLTAVFLHNLVIESGAFETVRRSLAGLTADRRLQTLLIAFAFGALIEGIAGFGAPVAITAAMMATLGFEPVYAAVLALLANTSPVAYGSIGIPVITLGNLVAPILGIKDPQVVISALSSMVGRQLPFFSLIVPGFLIVVLAGWRGMWEVFPAVAVCGVSFAITQAVVSNVIGPELTDVLAALVALACLGILLRFWRPKTVWRFKHEAASPVTARGPGAMAARLRPWDVIRAWFPYVILVLVIVLGRIDTVVRPIARQLASDPKHPYVLPDWINVTKWFNSGNVAAYKATKPWFSIDWIQISGKKLSFPFWQFPWPGLHNEMVRQSPIVPTPAKYGALFNLDFLATAGTLVLIAALLSGIWLGVGPIRQARVFGRTCVQMRWAALTVASILGIAFVMNYSGMTSTLGLAFANTGFLFPFFSAFIGMLGVFLSGSDTSSNTLFGPMQAITAQQLSSHGTNVSPILTAATNSSGGVMGKMISPQNLSVGAAAIGKVGEEGNIFRRTLGHALLLTTAMGVLAMLQAYVFPGIVPTVGK